MSVSPPEPDKQVKNRRHATLTQCCEHHQANAWQIPTNTHTEPKIIPTYLTVGYGQTALLQMQMKNLPNLKQGICEFQKHFSWHQDIFPEKGQMGTTQQAQQDVEINWQWQLGGGRCCRLLTGPTGCNSFIREQNFFNITNRFNMRLNKWIENHNIQFKNKFSAH
jgi:hypothetical protein